jgi:hypothetical protein
MLKSSRLYLYNCYTRDAFQMFVTNTVTWIFYIDFCYLSYYVIIINTKDNQINKVQWVDFQLENVLVSLHSLKIMGSIIFKEWRVTRTFSYTEFSSESSCTCTCMVSLFSSRRLPFSPLWSSQSKQHNEHKQHGKNMTHKTPAGAQSVHMFIISRHRRSLLLYLHTSCQLRPRTRQRLDYSA